MATETLLDIDQVNHWLTSQCRSIRWLALQSGVDDSHLWRTLHGQRPFMGETQRKVSDAIHRWNGSLV